MGTEQSAINKFALNDILTGLATGLNDAQKQLRNVAPYDEFGRPNVMYQLPYLDFELQVNSEFEEIKTETTSGGGGSSTLPFRFGAPRASFKFSTVKSSENKSVVEMKSKISGRYIAVAPNEGLPQMVLLAKVDTQTTGDTQTIRIPIVAELSNTSGEKLKNSLIEFNIDEELTKSLNTSSIILPELEIAEVRTNDEGIATTYLKVNASQYNSGAFNYAIQIGFATIIKTISVTKN